MKKPCGYKICDEAFPGRFQVGELPHISMRSGDVLSRKKRHFVEEKIPHKSLVTQGNYIVIENLSSCKFIKL